MNILFILVPVGILLSGAGALAFRWAVRNGQMDDPDYGSLIVLMDDEPSQEPLSNRTQK